MNEKFFNVQLNEALELDEGPIFDKVTSTLGYGTADSREANRIDRLEQAEIAKVAKIGNVNGGRDLLWNLKTRKAKDILKAKMKVWEQNNAANHEYAKEYRKKQIEKQNDEKLPI